MNEFKTKLEGKDRIPLETKIEGSLFELTVVEDLVKFCTYQILTSVELRFVHLLFKPSILHNKFSFPNFFLN